MSEPGSGGSPLGASGGEGAVREVLRRRIEEAVREFGSRQMSVRPKAVAVSLDCRELVVTLRPVISPAESECARSVHGRRLIEEYHREVYEVARPALESAVTGILGRAVEASTFSLDARTGGGVIVFALAAGVGSR